MFLEYFFEYLSATNDAKFLWRLTWQRNTFFLVMYNGTNGEVLRASAVYRPSVTPGQSGLKISSTAIMPVGDVNRLAVMKSNDT